MIPTSKGGSELAQMMMQNRATQATGMLDTITQPYAEPLPTLGSLAPVTADASATETPKPAPRTDAEFGYKRFADLPLIDKQKYWNGAGGGTGGGAAYQQSVRSAPTAAAQAAAKVYQPSQAQLLAQAINERAKARGS